MIWPKSESCRALMTMPTIAGCAKDAREAIIVPTKAIIITRRSNFRMLIRRLAALCGGLSSNAPMCACWVVVDIDGWPFWVWRLADS